MLSPNNRTQSISQYHNLYVNTSLNRYNFVPIYNQTINQSGQFDYSSLTNAKIEKKMSRKQMEDMKKDVQNLKNRMKSIMSNQNIVPMPRIAFSSLENCNAKQNQFLTISQNTNCVPNNSLNSSIMGQKNNQKEIFQDIKFSQTPSINNLSSINKLISKGSIATKHSINFISTQKDIKENIIKQTNSNFDNQIAYEKEILEYKTKIATIQFQKDNLQRTLDRTETRLQIRDQEIIKMKQRIYSLDDTQHKIDQKQSRWKSTISKLQKQLVQAKLYKNNPNLQTIFKEKANQTNSLRQQLRKKNEKIQHLQQTVQQNNKKFNLMISEFNSQRIQMIIKLKQTERKTNNLLFQKERELAILKQQLQNLKQSLKE